MARWYSFMVQPRQQSCAASGWHTEWLTAPQQIRPLMRMIATAMRQKRYRRREVIGMRVALTEAIDNAFAHGNRYDATKHVEVRCIVTNVCATVEVEDQGDGFNRAKIPDPTAPENVDRPQGRGIFLMCLHTNWLRYNKRGNCVTLCRRRSVRSNEVSVRSRA